jgi:hypothetical protein
LLVEVAVLQILVTVAEAREVILALLACTQFLALRILLLLAPVAVGPQQTQAMMVIAEPTQQH